MKKQILSKLAVILGLLLLTSMIAKSQERTISGTVTSSDEGEPLPGVNIITSGTVGGTISNAEGKYSLSVPDDEASLVFSYVGFNTQEITIGNSTIIDVVLVPDLKQLEEIVVTGYGTQKRANVTGAIGSVPANIIASRPIISPVQALAGTVAGVNIVNRAGDPGAAISVRIRGVGTVGVNQPLWVIDGVPVVQTTNNTVNTSSTTDSNPLAGINPDDIESIDVLKDASAAAIYGSRAANGVIIVTTKRGEAGRTKVKYSGFVGVGNVRKKVEVLNVDEYIDIQAELGRDMSEFRGQPTWDWQDLVYRSAPMQSHNIAVSGGSEDANFYVSGGYLNQDGIEFGQSFERYSMKINSDLHAGRWTFGESVMISQTDRLTQSEGVGSCCAAAFNASQNSPYFGPYDASQPDGYNLEDEANIGEGTALNLLKRTDIAVNETRILTREVLGNLYGQLEIIEGLKFRMDAGIDYIVGDNFFNQAEVYWGDVDGTRDSRLIQSRPIEMTTNWSNTLTYSKTFGEDHNLIALIGYEETNYRFDKLRIQGNILFNPAIKFASVSLVAAPGNEADHWALRGLLGRINYNYAGKYLATVNVRRDASSRFSKNNRDDVFPSISLGWRLSEESFFPQGGVFDDVKLRVGYGQAGNQFTGVNFAYLSALSTTIRYVVGPGQGGVFRAPAPVNFSNEDLKWETSTSTNIGLDLGLLGSKLTFTVDYFDKTSSDVLIGLPLPWVSGFSLNADANIGEISNSGFEFSTDYRNVKGDWTYGAGGNFTTIKNEVKDLGTVPNIISGISGGQTHRTIVGETLGHFYGYVTDGLYQDQGAADNAIPDNQSAGAEAGDIKFVDVNGDGQVDANDRTNIGSPIPGFYYGMYFNAGYKGFALDIQLRGVGDVQIYNAARSTWEDLSGNQNFTTTVKNRWTGPNTSNEMPRLSRTDPNDNNRFSDRWIENAAYMRIQVVELSYTLPAAILNNTDWIQAVRFYIGVQNLATFTNYSGFDPEVGRAQSFQKGEFPLATGQDGGASPQPQIWRFGWNITF